MKKYITKISFYLFSSFLFCLALPALADEGEVTLWGKAKAGMTPEEVMDAYPDKATMNLTEEKKNKDGTDKLVTIKNIKMTSNSKIRKITSSFSVDFYFYNNHLLRVVLLNASGDIISRELYNTLLNSLRDKYGNEINSCKSAKTNNYHYLCVDNEVNWHLSDKNISLQYFDRYDNRILISYEYNIVFTGDNI